MSYCNCDTRSGGQRTILVFLFLERYNLIGGGSDILGKHINYFPKYKLKNAWNSLWADTFCDDNFLWKQMLPDLLRSWRNLCVLPVYPTIMYFAFQPNISLFLPTVMSNLQCSSKPIKHFTELEIKCLEFHLIPGIYFSGLGNGTKQFHLFLFHL